MKSIEIRVVLTLLLGALALPIALPAADATAEAAAPVRWRSAAIWGADVRSLAIHPHDPDRVLAGTSSGQVYLSTDGGDEWRPAGEYLPFPGWVVSTLTFDPNHPERLWAGLRGVWGDGLVSVSDDLGKTWLPRVGDLPDVPVYSLALVPGREDRLYAGTLDGVWGTRDGGETWRKLTGDLPEVAKVTSLLVPSGEPDTVIAGTWRRAYKSTDGGHTWRGVFDGMFLDSEVFALVPTGQPGEMWAPTCNWVYQSQDGGESWRRFVTGMDERRATSFATLEWGRLLSGTVSGLYVSDDEGRHWRRTSLDSLAIHTIAHHAGRPGRVFFGTDGAGVWVSNDGGDSLRPSSAGMTNLRAADVAAAGDELLVAVNHAGPGSGIYVSKDGGRSFPERWEGLPTVLDLAAEAAGVSGEAGEGERPPRVWAATEAGLFERRDKVWTRVEAFGETRVEAVVARGGRVVVQTHDGVWELERTSDPASGPPGRFVKTPYSHGRPRSATIRGGDLWVTDAAGLYRVADGSNHTVSAPYEAGRVAAVGDHLLYVGTKGAWRRKELSDPWVPLTSKPARVLETGHGRYPALFLEAERVHLLDAAGAPAGAVELPIPARFVETALIHDGRLHLATSGFGLLTTDLPAEEPTVEAP